MSPTKSKHEIPSTPVFQRKRKTSSFPSPPRPWCFFLRPNVSTTQAPIARRRVETIFLKGTKTEQDNGQGEDNFHAFFLLLLLLSSPGGFFIHDTLSQKENANGELLLTRVFAQIAFRKPKNKRGKQSLSTFHPPTLHHNSLTNVSTEKSYQIRQNIFIRKISLFYPSHHSPESSEPPRAAKEAGFFPHITQKTMN